MPRWIKWDRAGEMAAGITGGTAYNWARTQNRRSEGVRIRYRRGLVCLEDWEAYLAQRGDLGERWAARPARRKERVELFRGEGGFKR